MVNPLIFSKRRRTELGQSSSSVRSSSNIHGQGDSQRGAREDIGEDDSLDDVIMAVDMKGRDSLGCCYYVAREERLCLMEDVKLGSLDMIETRMHLPLLSR